MVAMLYSLSSVLLYLNVSSGDTNGNVNIVRASGSIPPPPPPSVL